ncbi:MAG: DNA repair protein RecO [Myxococcota bacterium]
MPEVRSAALVLRTFDHGESDRLVHLYTEALGRVSAIAKGARRSRRRFPGTLEIFNVLEVRLVDPPRASLMRLEAASFGRAFEGLGRDLGRYAIACQLLEMLDRFTGEGEASPALYRFAIGALGVLESEQPDRLLALLVVAKTLARVGLRPELLVCTGCGAELSSVGEGTAFFAPRHGGGRCPECAEPGEVRVGARILRALEIGIRRPLREREALGLEGTEVEEIEHLIDRFFRFHVGAELRTAPFLRTVLAREGPSSRLLDGGRDPGDTAPAPPLGTPRAAASEPVQDGLPESLQDDRWGALQGEEELWRPDG